MNKKQKIIVSITGIFIVLLALVGLTYAYFLTRITGNESEKSISVTTANLILEYADGNGKIIPTEKIYPGYKRTKTFTATNNGNDEVDYVVVLEDVVNELTRQSDLVYSLTCGVYSKNDINTNGTLKENATKVKDCIGIDETFFPNTTDIEILVRNSVAVDYANYYELTVHYKEMNIDQSVDMDKTFEAHVNIKDPNEYNPYLGDKDSLAYNIINNSIAGTNGTKYRETTLSKVAEETNVHYFGATKEVNLSEIAELSYYWYTDELGFSSECSDELIGKEIYDYGYHFTNTLLVTGCNGDEPIVALPIVEKESSLSLTDDNYTASTGVKSYYYRGNVQDNYVFFSGKTWKIVRIEGDGSIKLILTTDIGEYSWGVKEENGKSIADYKNSTTGIKNALNTWLNKTDGDGVRTNITTNAEKLLKVDEWCLGNLTNAYSYNSPYVLLSTTVTENIASNTAFYYETARNLYGYGVIPNATLICNGETDISKIGTLTADEVVYAGGSAKGSNYYYSQYYYLDKYTDWWTLSLNSYDSEYSYDHYAFRVFNDGYSNYGKLNGWYISGEKAVLPAVTLNKGVKITSGDGTKDNPYIIHEG